MSHITLNTTIHEIFYHPQIGDLNQYLIYCLDRDLWLNEHVNAIMDQPLTAAKEINWSPPAAVSAAASVVSDDVSSADVSSAGAAACVSVLVLVLSAAPCDDPHPTSMEATIAVVSSTLSIFFFIKFYLPITL